MVFHWFRFGETNSGMGSNECWFCHMMTSWHGNAFHITGPLWGESQGFPSLRASNVELWCFLFFLDWTCCWANNWLMFFVGNTTINKDYLILIDFIFWWFETPWHSCDITGMKSVTIGWTFCKWISTEIPSSMKNMMYVWLTPENVYNCWEYHLCICIN